ncbi:F-box/kelch-repeat protein At3g23880-like [Chenopodium quinoa]|uniref:F-box/kelch-repeat protein At3g23880-like n=1 Tax=Chenopodium quinoa TaxID=63459 RepID=UPI000B78239E|nr:F-box/kelch-repeat protein At3g23880-like [Chenopodium quinoa]
MDEHTQKPKFQTLTIPEDLIFENILPRLPIKSITRFKSVSKSWLSTISTQKFAKSHLKLYTSPSPQFLLLSSNRDSDFLFTSVTFDQHGRVEETLKLNYTFNGGPSFHFLGCCNGLVCFRDKNFNFSICNPLIQQRSSIIKCPDFGLNQKIIGAGFGYVSSIDDYKIACLTKTSNENNFHVNELVDFDVYMFSLTTLKWERSTPGLNNVEGVAIARDVVPVLVNDVLYWCAINFGNVVGSRSSCCVRKVYRLNKDDLSWVKMYDLNRDQMHLLGVSETGKWLVSNDNLAALLDPSKSFYRQYQGETKIISDVAKANAELAALKAGWSKLAQLPGVEAE